VFGVPNALRSLFKQPVVAAVAILTLGLGIGGNAAVFSVVNAVLLRPLPFERPDAVVALTERAAKFPSLSASWQNYADWRDQNAVFTALAAYRSLNVTVTGTDQPERLPAKMLTAAALPMLGVQPTLGRRFSADDDRAGAAPVAMISEGLWARRFSRDRAVLGRTLTVDNVPRTVIGVLPGSFQLVQAADLYVPMGPWAATLPDDRSWHPGIFPVGRLKPGVTLERARAEMEAIGRRLAKEYAATNIAAGINVTRLHEQMVTGVRPALLMLLGAVTLVLLIACANVANLLLARAVARRRELAVRAALGASRRHLVRHLLAEHLVLAALGGLVGLLLANWGVSSMVALAGPAVPDPERVTIDMPVFVFSLVVSLLAGLVSGVAPALTASRLDLRETLNEESRGSSVSGRGSRLRAGLVVAEVALATVLLVGAGLLLQSFTRLQSQPTGFDASRLLVADLPLSPTTYATDDQRARFAEAVLAQVKALPGVKNAGMTTTLPMAGGGATLHFNIQGRPPKGPEDYVLAAYRAATPDYLSTLGVPLLAGRLLDARDRRGSQPVVVINQAFAQTFFAGQDPLGQRLQVGTEPDPAIPSMDIVGVVGNVRQGFDAEAAAEMYVPYLQGAPDPVLGGLFRTLSIVARSEGDPLLLAGGLRQALRDVDRNQPVVKLGTLEAAMGATVAAPRFRTRLVGIFAVVAVLLAAIGVYGVMAYSVSQRRQEIGLRMALGASGREVVGLVVADGLRLAVTGAVAGVGGGLAAGRLLHGFLFQTSAADPLALAAAPVLLTLTALLATWLPALRATRVDPNITLRS
jgi:putative ABC transport system permease protein